MNPEEAWNKLEDFDPENMAEEGGQAFHEATEAAKQATNIGYAQEEARQEEERFTRFLETFPRFEPFLNNPTFSRLVEQGAKIECIQKPHTETFLWFQTRTPNRLEAGTERDPSWEQSIDMSWFVTIFTLESDGQTIKQHLTPRTISVLTDGKPITQQSGSPIDTTLTVSGAKASPQYALFVGHDGRDVIAVEEGLDSYAVKTNDTLYLVSNSSPTPPNAL